MKTSQRLRITFEPRTEHPPVEVPIRRRSIPQPPPQASPVKPSLVATPPGSPPCDRRGRQRLPWQAGLLLLLGTLLLPAPGRSALSSPLTWRWSNPRPHGADIVDQATVGPLTVQVGERGQIFLSDDWYTWTARDSGTRLALRSVTFFKGRLVITGEAGAVMVADDPWDFLGMQLGTTDWLESVAASDTRVVAVGDNAAIYTSTNAIGWTRLTPGFSNWLRGVAYGANTFVAVGEGGIVVTGANGGMGGMTWQIRTYLPFEPYRVAWMGDHFLAVGSYGNAATSENGLYWSLTSSGATNTLFTATGEISSHLIAGREEARLAEDDGGWMDQLSAALPAPVPAWTYYSGLWNSNYYLLTGRTGMCVEGTKTNDTSSTLWRTIAPSARTWLWDLMRTPSHYLAVGDHGTIFTSPNGIDWDLELTPDPATNAVLLGVGGSTNFYLAVGSQGTVLWATNIYLWNALPSPPTPNDLRGVCFDGSQFILTGGEGTVLTSPTGTHWTGHATPTTAFLMSIDRYPGGLVTVGAEGTILTSTDGGAHWTPQVSGTTSWLMQVRWLNDRLIAVGGDGVILTSVDGVNWTSHPSGTTAWLNAVACLDNNWFIAGNQGTVLGSDDGTNWLDIGTLTSKSLYGLRIHDGQLVSVGTEGVVLRSQLVPDPTPIRIANYNRASGFNVFLLTGGVDQQFRLQSSTNLLDWTDGARLELSDGTGTVLYVEEADTSHSVRTFYRTLRLQ